MCVKCKFLCVCARENERENIRERVCERGERERERVVREEGEYYRKSIRERERV